MAILLNTILSDTIAGLETAVNAFLAPLVGGSAVTIIGFDVTLADLDRYKGIQFAAMITYNNVGAAAQADPFIFEVFDQGNAADLETEVNAWYATRVAGSDFVTGIRNVSFPNNPSRLPRLDAWAVYSEATADAATNWALI